MLNSLQPPSRNSTASTASPNSSKRPAAVQNSQPQQPPAIVSKPYQRGQYSQKTLNQQRAKFPGQPSREGNGSVNSPRINDVRSPRPGAPTSGHGTPVRVRQSPAGSSRQSNGAPFGSTSSTISSRASMVSASASARPARPRMSTYRAVLARKGYLVNETLGSGTYSKVKLAYHYSRNPDAQPGSEQGDVRKVAVKIIDRERAPTDYQTNFLPRELDIWPRLSHVNLVRMLDHFTDNRRVYMILELAERGDCLKYVQANGTVPELTARKWICQIADAIRYLHNQDVCHRDLKLENCLLDASMNIKICDFGFVRRVNYDSATGQVDLSRTYCGSKSYAAPEILQGQPYDPKKADVWAIGVILFIFVTGKMPFDESKGNRRILEDQRRLELPWPRSRPINPACRAAIEFMFEFDYRPRPDIDAVRANEWIEAERRGSVTAQHHRSGNLTRVGEAAASRNARGDERSGGGAASETPVTRGAERGSGEEKTTVKIVSPDKRRIATSTTQRA